MNTDTKERILNAFFEATNLVDFLTSVSELTDIPVCVLDLDLNDPTRTDPPETHAVNIFDAIPIVTLTSGDTKKGYLGIPKDQVLTEDVREILEFTAQLASKMPEVNVSIQYGDSAYTAGIKELLYQTSLSRMGSLRAQLGLSRYKEDIPDKCILINIVSLAGDSVMKQLKEKIWHRIANEGDILFNYGDSVLLFIMSHNKDGITDSFKKRLGEILQEENAIGCISDPFNDPVRDFRLRRFYNRNEEVLLYLKSKYHDAPGLLVEYDDYRIVPMLMNALENQGVFGNYQYICRTVMDIAEYDKENHTDYLNTLRGYLSTGSSLQETASMIHVHRNTVAYRVRRISELFHIDYASSEQCFQLMLSLRLYDIVEHIS